MADYEDKVIEILGKVNNDKLLSACAKASIQEDQLLQIAKKLHGTVYGNLLRKSQASKHFFQGDLFVFNVE